MLISVVSFVLLKVVFFSQVWVLLCSVVGYCILVMLVVGGSMCNSSYRCVSVAFVHPVAILSVVFCVICILMMFVFDTSGGHYRGNIL